jgi:RNA polymerase sigma factor (TIGR02999 family)
VTGLLLRWRQGDDTALARLMPLVERQLHQIARRYMAGERPEHSLQPTALVNEAYLRLIDAKSVSWHDRAHFLAVAARVMRHILVDHARSRQYQKRGGVAVRVTLDEGLVVAGEPDRDFVALDDALTALAGVDSRKSQVVELRFFGGLTLDETAEALNISRDTVKRDWKMAQLWLLRELRGAKP